MDSQLVFPSCSSPGCSQTPSGAAPGCAWPDPKASGTSSWLMVLGEQGWVVAQFPPSLSTSFVWRGMTVQDFCSPGESVCQAQ